MNFSRTTLFQMTHKNILLTGKNCANFDEAVRLLPPAAQQKSIISMQQVHSNIIKSVNKSTFNNSKSYTLQKTDGCYTTLNEVVLSIKTADCLPILLSYKPLNLIAAVHAGRKGTELKITTKLLEQIDQDTSLLESMKNSEEKIYIHFAPAICGNCYQIDRKADTHYNLIAENKQQIISFFKNSNIPLEKIKFEITQECTLHNNDKYYSYRNHGPGVQMNYSFIWNA